MVTERLFVRRRHGHSERDDPTLTQPLLYKAIGQRKPLRETFTAILLSLGTIEKQEAMEIAARSHEKLEWQLEKARSLAPEVLSAETQIGPWKAYHGGPVEERDTVFTGVSKGQIINILTIITNLPDNSVHVETVSYLKDLDLFRDIPDEELVRIAAIARTVEYDRGQFVCRQGEQGVDLFAIITGSVSIQQARIHFAAGAGRPTGPCIGRSQDQRCTRRSNFNSSKTGGTQSPNVWSAVTPKR